MSQTTMTPQEFLELLKAYGFHIGDGMGDWCSGEDDEAMLVAATEILEKFK